MSEYVLAGHKLESPLINAAGSITGGSPEGIVRETGELAETAIGAITVGSFTVPPQEGNEAKYGSPVYHHDPVTGKTHNAIGLRNIGEAAAIELAPRIIGPAHDAGKPIIYSGSPTAAPEHGSSVDQAVSLARTFLETDVDLVEINVSCPNVVVEGGGRKPLLGHDFEGMEELVERLYSEVGETGKLGLKLPPYLDEERFYVPAYAKILQTRNVFRFLTVCNTIPDQIACDAAGRPILSVPGGKGGLSGPATAEVGRDQLRLWREHTDKDIISTLGVHSGRELATRLELGAVAGSGVTFLWKGRNRKAAVTDMLDELVEAQT